MTTWRGDTHAAVSKSLPAGCNSSVMGTRATSWGGVSSDELHHRRAVLFKRQRGECEVTSDTVADVFATGVHSTGFLALDELLSRGGVGNSGGGGVLCSRLTEVYGPPMAGKSYLARRIVTVFIRKMERLRVTPTLDRLTVQRGADGAVGGLAWDVYVCLTGSDSGLSDRLQHSVGADGWHTLLRDLEPQPSSKLVPSCATSSHASARTHVCATYLDAHMHFVRPTHPNDLLTFLSWLAFAEPTIARHDDGGRNRHVLLVIDSLTSVWLHPALRTRTSTHPMRWFAAELHRLLRCCLRTHTTPVSVTTASATESKPAGCPLAHAPRRTVTVITVNGCGSYNFHVEPPTVSELLPNWNAASTWGAFPPKPLGEEGWWRAVDYRLLVEPATPHVVALLAPMSTRQTRNDDEGCNSGATRSASPALRLPGQDEAQVQLTVRPHAKASLVKGGNRILFSVLLTDDPTVV